MLERYENQKTRGMTSYGYYVPSLDKLVHNVKETRIKALLRRTRGKNDAVLFHHRRSTSTPDVRNACHPFSTKDTFENEYIGIHNGMIHNSHELKQQHAELGIHYVSTQDPNEFNIIKFNDSEALIYDLALFFEGKIDKLKAAGSDAFIVVKNDPTGKKTKLFFGHNSGSPLVMQRSKRSLTIASVGRGEQVPPNKLHIFDFETKELRVIDMDIPVSNYKAPVYPAPYTIPASSRYHESHETKFPSSTLSNEEEHENYWIREGSEPEDEYDYTDTDYDELDPDDFSTDGNMVIASMLKENRIKRKKNSKNLKDWFGYDTNGDFIMRPGSKKQIKASLIKQNFGKISAASLAAEGEVEGCQEEMARINDVGLNQTDEDEIEETLDYYTRLTMYLDDLMDIAVELYEDAKTQEERAKKLAKAKEEDKSVNANLFLPSTR